MLVGSFCLRFGITVEKLVFYQTFWIYKTLFRSLIKYFKKLISPTQTAPLQNYFLDFHDLHD